jgi:hypothetical protein
MSPVAALSFLGEGPEELEADRNLDGCFLVWRL